MGFQIFYFVGIIQLGQDRNSNILFCGDYSIKKFKIQPIPPIF
jgi:hypothetical protein